MLKAGSEGWGSVPSHWVSRLICRHTCPETFIASEMLPSCPVLCYCNCRVRKEGTGLNWPIKGLYSWGWASSVSYHFLQKRSIPAQGKQGRVWFRSPLPYLHLYPSGRRKRTRKQWRVVMADTWTLMNLHMSNKY